MRYKQTDTTHSAEMGSSIIIMGHRWKIMYFEVRVCSFTKHDIIKALKFNRSNWNMVRSQSTFWSPFWIFDWRPKFTSSTLSDWNAMRLEINYKNKQTNFYKKGGKGDDKGWDGWMASPTRWTWVEWTPGVGDGQGGLACCDSWGRKVSDTTKRLNWTKLNSVGVFPFLSTLSSIYYL